MLSLLVIVPFSARAGIFSLVTDILGNASGQTLDSKSQSVQSMALLQATQIYSDVPREDLTDIQIVDSSSLLAEAGPLGAAGNLASTSPVTSDQIVVYAVRASDSLSGIAKMFNVSVNTILWANDLKKGAVVHEGDSLVILPISGLQYSVKKGDSLDLIAKKYGGDKAEIIAFNNLESDKIIVGMTIVIPDGDAIVTPAQAAGTKLAAKDTRPNYVGYFIRPLVSGRKSQGIHGNNGIDIAAPAGTPIIASAAGTVILAKGGGYNGGYGNYVVVKHPNGTQTLYAHATSLFVSVGQQVDQGQKIASVGNTGRSTGNHLHFEVRGAKNPF